MLLNSSQSAKVGTSMDSEIHNPRRAVVFSFSQTGQLDRTIQAFVEPFLAAGWQMRHVSVQPARPYPFPWPVRRFFDVFPECVDNQAAIDLATPESDLRSDPDELVILAYQVWFLAPSLPARTLLNAHPGIFADRKVLSLIACRNMWYSAAVEVDRRLGDVGARHLGAVVATDTRSPFITLATTLRWLLKGEREGKLGRAGVDEKELFRIRDCGAAWVAGSRDIQGARITYPLAAADLTAGRSFRRWGRLIRAASRRSPALRAATLSAFVCWLAVSILLMPLIGLVTLPFHRRIDAATDRTLAGVTGDHRTETEQAVEVGAAAMNLALRGGDGGEIRVSDLSRDTFLLLFGKESERAWLDAVGYVSIMSTTRVSGIAVCRDEEPDGHRLCDPSGDVIARYGLRDGAAVLVQPGGVVSAVLPGADPYQELIRVVAARTT